MKNFLVLLVLVGTLCFYSDLQASPSNNGGTYTTTVEYFPCEGSSAMSRVEKWHYNDKCVYAEVRACDGKVVNVGKRPEIVNYNGQNVWNMANENRNKQTTAISVALLNYLEPVSVTSTEYEPDGSSCELKVEYIFEFSYLDAIPAANFADTEILRTESTIELITDKPVKAQLVDLVSGNTLSEPIEVSNNYTFNISNLPSGCRYTIAVYQSFAGIVDDLLIYNHNFCK